MKSGNGLKTHLNGHLIETLFASSWKPERQVSTRKSICVLTKQESMNGQRIKEELYPTLKKSKKR